MNRNGSMVLTEDLSFSLNTRETGCNNNLLVVGPSGCGKTRSVVTPNILQAHGSYIVSDPKGALYRTYRAFFLKKGYLVKNYDFIHMKGAHYDPFVHVKTQEDVHRIAHLLTMEPNERLGRVDPFWQECTEMLVETLIHIMMEHFAYRDRVSLRTLMELITLLTNSAGEVPMKAITDLVMDIQSCNSSSIAVNKYRRFYSITDAEKTLACILMSLNAKMNAFASEEILAMTDTNDFDFKTAGTKKAIIFVSVSDIDRSMDNLCDLFFSQAMLELCEAADGRSSGSLAVPVNFVLDDFATNLRLEDFPRWISTIRARNISAMIILQSESQLEAYYGANAQTVVTNCDTYVYLGGSDIRNADRVATRADRPLREILNMRIGEAWVFRRGSDPYHGRLLQLDNYMMEMNELEF